MYKKITANLVVGNVNETLDFYEQTLGFGLVMAVPRNSQQIVTARDADAPLDFAILRGDDVELMIQSRKSLARELPASGGKAAGVPFTLYVQVADAGELFNSIRSKVTVVKDLHATFYGAREFWIRDHDGHILTFAGNP
jgi:uncharacterized glyoxalase superfamily protein PhnB